MARKKSIHRIVAVERNASQQKLKEGVLLVPKTILFLMIKKIIHRFLSFEDCNYRNTMLEDLDILEYF
jgi:hypothetical protein